MARTFVADSDDDDDGGYSPLPSPRGEAGGVGAAAGSSGRVSHATSSTDLAFFQSVFDEQNDAARVYAADNTNPEQEGLPGSGGPADGGNPPTQTAHDDYLLTSVTEPTAAKGRQVSSGRVTNELTQVTTPRCGKEQKEHDPWDIPSSPESSISRGRMNPGNGSNVSSLHASRLNGTGAGETHLERGESPRRTTKRRKIERPVPSQEHDDVDLVTMPASNGTNVVGRAPAPLGPSSHLAPTLPADSNSSLFIVPKNLPPGQKMRYQNVGLPSSDGAASTGKLPRHQQNGPNPHYWSSGSATNVNTPRAGDYPCQDDIESGLGRPDTPQSAEQGEVGSPGQRWSSSPDVISLVEPTPKGGRQVGKRTLREGGAKGPRTQEKEPLESDDTAYRVKPGADDLRANEEGDADYAAAPKAVGQKRPRGRPKKKTGSDSASAAANPPGSHATDGEPAIKEKRRRGRPRKSATVVEDTTKRSPPVSPVPEGAEEGECAHETDGDDKEEARDGGEQPDQTRFALQEAEEAAESSKGTLDKEGEEEEAEEGGAGQHGTAPKTTTGGRAASDSDPDSHGQDKTMACTWGEPGGGSAKPLYRVGLSKRSRIAPLLKSVRK